jgi:hypothetical protein
VTIRFSSALFTFHATCRSIVCSRKMHAVLRRPNTVATPQEPEHLVRRSVADLISAIAKIAVPHGQWDNLLQANTFLHRRLAVCALIFKSNGSHTLRLRMSLSSICALRLIPASVSTPNSGSSLHPSAAPAVPLPVQLERTPRAQGSGLDRVYISHRCYRQPLAPPLPTAHLNFCECTLGPSTAGLPLLSHSRSRARGLGFRV